MKRTCCVLLLCAVVFCGYCTADDGFTINTIARGVKGAASVAVDIDNTPIVVYETYEHLVLVTQTPTGYETNSIPYTYFCSVPKLKVTSNNELALSFLMAGAWIYYGSEANWFDWVFSQVEGPDVTSVDMTLTANDIPHIAYNYQGRIYHAFFDIHSQQWVKEELCGFGNHTFTVVAIDVASDGRIMILCSEGLNIRTAVYSDGYWNYLPWLQGDRPDCSFTCDNLPAIAFTRSGQLVYAVYINDVIGWVETVVAPAGGTLVSLEHSSTGIPGIAYVDNSTLMYATNVAGGWTTVQVDERGNHPDLIFDSNDKPLIVYNSYDDCLGLPVLKLAGIGLDSFSIADLNNDEVVNFADFAILAEYWMESSAPPDFLPGDLKKDGIVDGYDLQWFCCYWLW